MKISQFTRNALRLARFIDKKAWKFQRGGYHVIGMMLLYYSGLISSLVLTRWVKRTFQPVRPIKQCCEN